MVQYESKTILDYILFHSFPYTYTSQQILLNVSFKSYLSCGDYKNQEECTSAITIKKNAGHRILFLVYLLIVIV